MSADNWAICPECLKKAKAKQEKLLKRVETDYGKIARGEYEKLLEQSRTPLKLKEMLREDYEIGITESGEFYVRYSGSCAEPGCNFEFSFEKDEQVLNG